MYLDYNDKFKIRAINGCLACENNLVTFILEDYCLKGVVNNAKWIEWESSANSQLVSGQGKPEAVFRVKGNGKVSINAKLNYDKITYSSQYSIWVGPPKVKNKVSTSETIYGPCSSTVSIKASFDGSETFYYSTPYRTFQSMSDYYGFHAMSEALGLYGTYINKISPIGSVYITAKNKCGSSNHSVHINYTDYNQYKAECNRASQNGNNGGIGGDGKLNSIKINDMTLSRDNTPVSIRIYDLKGHLVYQDKSTTNFTIHNTPLGSGFYIIEYMDSVGNVTTTKTQLRR